MVVGMVDFFSSFGNFRGPQLFWCFFVGMPLLFFGSVCCMTGFMGAAARYSAAEAAPVAADTFNYVADETQAGVTTVAAAAARGFRGEHVAPTESVEGRLKRLEEMRRTALITEEEYLQQRQRILGSL